MAHRCVSLPTRGPGLVRWILVDVLDYFSVNDVEVFSPCTSLLFCLKMSVRICYQKSEKGEIVVLMLSVKTVCRGRESHRCDP